MTPRPWLASAVDIADSLGLADVLDDETEAQKAVHPVELFEPSRSAGQISVMAAGRSSPDVLPGIDWCKARTVFRSLSQRHSIVFLDSPPILAVNDALLFGGIVDGVLLVVAPGGVDRDEVRRAKEQLEPVGAPVIGAVLNQFDPKLHGRPNHPYRGYYLDGRR